MGLPCSPAVGPAGCVMLLRRGGPGGGRRERAGTGTRSGPRNGLVRALHRRGPEEAPFGRTARVKSLLRVG